MFCIRIEKALLAPTLLSVRKKASSSDAVPSEETTTGEDEEEEEEEDPTTVNLEQDEIEPQRESIEPLFVRDSILHFNLESPIAPTETVEMGQPSQNVLRLLEDDEKVRLIFLAIPPIIIRFSSDLISISLCSY